jgi:hypothetical protein
VPVGEDHGGVALAPVASPGLDQRVYLVRREVLAGARTQSGPAGGLPADNSSNEKADDSISGLITSTSETNAPILPRWLFGREGSTSRAGAAKLKADRAARIEAELDAACGCTRS